MITVLGLGLLILVACFGFVLLFGAPYLPTLDKQTALALDMAGFSKGQTLLELGCGDGKVLIAAAKRGGKAVGYELNPLLVLVCKIRTWRYRQQVAVKWGNFWTQDWPAADVIFVFALQKYMLKLDNKVMQLSHKPVKVISFAFTIPDKKPLRQDQALSLYEYR